jgi:hypothetical protein
MIFHDPSGNQKYGKLDQDVLPLVQPRNKTTDKILPFSMEKITVTVCI